MCNHRICLMSAPVPGRSVPLELQQRPGHASITMTMRYAVYQPPPASTHYCQLSSMWAWEHGAAFTMSDSANPGTSGSCPQILLMAIGVLLAATASCETRSGPPADEFRPVVTLQDVMSAMIGPSADVLWSAVTTVETVDGLEEKGPETDEEWENLRRSATTIAEAANLLLIEGRRVAREGATARSPGFELEPDQIASLVAQDRETWIRLVHELQESGQLLLNAIDARNPEALFDAGGVLNDACENCHQIYWYPSN